MNNFLKGMFAQVSFLVADIENNAALDRFRKPDPAIVCNDLTID